MDKIKGQLAGVAALLGVIAAIGGGFVKYGEIVTKLDELESQEQPCHLSCKFDMWNLIFAHRDLRCSINQNICALKQRIT